jgi:hypothetical protein
VAVCGNEPVPLLDSKKEEERKEEREDSEHHHGVAVPVVPGVHQPITPKKQRETQDPGTAFYTTPICIICNLFGDDI